MPLLRRAMVVGPKGGAASPWPSKGRQPLPKAGDTLPRAGKGQPALPSASDLLQRWAAATPTGKALPYPTIFFFSFIF